MAGFKDLQELQRQFDAGEITEQEFRQQVASGIASNSSPFPQVSQQTRADRLQELQRQYNDGEITEQELRSKVSGELVVKTSPLFGDKEEDLFSEDDIAEIPFQEQCVLLENIEKIVQKNYTTVYNHFIPIHGSTGTLINALHSKRNIQPFWDITPEQLSHLQPTVRIFKVRYNENNEEIDAIELPFAEFENEENLNDITNPNISRGGGANLVNFDWKLQGSNPAEATNIIECQLKFRFDSLQDFVKQYRTSNLKGEPAKISFTEFFTLPPKLIKERGESCAITTTRYNPDYFTFRVVVGWADLSGAFHNRPDLRQLNNVLKDDRRIFTLTMTNHNIEFSQEGPVNITIEANARIDVVSYLQGSDIYAPYRESLDDAITQKNTVKARTESLEKCITDTSPKTEEEKLEQERDRLEEALDRVQIEKVKMWSVFLGELLNKNKVYAIDVPLDSVVASQKDRSYYSALVKSKDENNEVVNRQVQAVLRSQSKNISDVEIREFSGQVLQKGISEEGMTENDKFAEESREIREGSIKSRVSKDKNTYTLPFIYLGDIIDLALKSLHGEQNIWTTGNQKTLLGDIVLFDPRVQRRYSINLADVPISVELFKEWFLRNVNGSRKGEVWPVKLFIKDVVEKLLSPALNPDGCFVNVPQRAIKVSFTYFSAKAKDGKDPLVPEKCARTTVNSIKELKRPITPSGEKISEYWVIYAAEDFPPGRIASIEQDWASGIYHFMIGRDKGLVKTINFNRADMPYMREARIVSDGDSQFARLREYYTADIEMVGNNLFVPGDAIFINPSVITLGDPKKTTSLGQIMGLVGYYRVINVASFIEAGVYKTSIAANWEAAGDGKSRSYTAQAAAAQNCLCDGADYPTVKDEIAMREVYRQNDLIILEPGVNQQICVEASRAGSLQRALNQRRAASGGYVPK